MALQEVLRLVVDADTRGAVQGIEHLGRTADRELSRSKTSLDKWGHSLTNIGASLIGVGSVALVGLGAAAMASEDAQLSVVKLENTLRNMPKLAGENSKQFIDLAASIQDVTAADGDAIVEAEALLGTFNLTANEIKSMTPLVVDLARKFDLDMASAATQVGKALDGNVGALKRNGISIDETLFATDRYAAVQKALADQVGGFAEAEGATFAGSLQRLKNELGDLAEGVGVGAVDAFTSMFGVVEGLTDRFSELSPEAQSAIGKVAAFGATGVVVAGGASVLVGQIILARERFGEVAAAARIAGTSIWGMRGSIVSAGISLGVLALGMEGINRVFPIEHANLSELENALLSLGRTGRVSGELAESMGSDLGKLKSAIAEVADPSIAESLDHTMSQIGDTLSFGLGVGDTQNLEDAKAKIDDIDKALATLAQRDPEAAAASVRALTGALSEQGIDASTTRGLLDDYNAALAEIDTAEATSGVQGLGGGFTDQAAAAEAAKVAIGEYQSALNASFDPLVGFMNAQDQTREAQDKLRVAQMELVAAVQEHGASSAEAAAAQAVYSDAQRDALGATVDLDAAAFELNEMIRTQGLSVSDARNRLFDMAIQSGFTRDEAMRLSAQLGQTASAAAGLGATDPNVDISASDRATPTIRQVDTELENLDGQSATVTIKQLFTTVGQAFGFGGGRAVGGPVTAGQAYIVGEKGPELLVPDKPGWVIPNDKYGQMVSAGNWGAAGGGGMSGGGVQHVHEHIYVQVDGATVAEANRNYKRNNGLDWRT